VTEFDNLKHSCRAALQLRKHRLLTKKLAERQAAAQQDAAAPAAKAARTSKTQSSAKAKKAAAAAAEAEATASPAYEDDDDDDEEYVDADYKMPVCVLLCHARSLKMHGASYSIPQFALFVAGSRGGLGGGGGGGRSNVPMDAPPRDGHTRHGC
jgi:hypothetical protein